MQFHLLAFAPFFVLLGTAATAGAMSVAIKMRLSRTRPMLNRPLAQVPAVQRRSAEILYFPAPKCQPAMPVERPLTGSVPVPWAGRL